MKYIRNVVWSLSPNTVVKNSKIFRNNVKNSIFKNYFLTESSYLPAYEKDWFWGNIIYTYYFLFHFSIFFSPLCVALMLIHEFIYTLENKKREVWTLGVESTFTKRWFIRLKFWQNPYKIPSLTTYFAIRWN